MTARTVKTDSWATLRTALIAGLVGVGIFWTPMSTSVAGATTGTTTAVTPTTRTAATVAPTSNTATAPKAGATTGTAAAAKPTSTTTTAGTKPTSTTTLATAKPTSATTAATKPTSTTTTASTKPTSAPEEIALQFYQIAIEAMVVEVNEKYTRQVGIQYSYVRNVGSPAIVKGVDVNAPITPPGVVVPQMTIIPGGFSFSNITRGAGIGFSLTEMDVGDGKIGMRLRALIEEGKAQIRSRPMALTLNKQMVRIETVDKVPYQDVTFAPGSPTGQIAIQFEPVGVKLHVMPDIRSLQEGLIELNLSKLEVSAVGGFVSFGNVQRPVFLRSEANTRVVVHDHDTLVVGGFKIEQESNRGQGVPFVRRIPVVKYLFSNENKSLERRDILFYITPHILKPGVQPVLPPRFQHQEALAGVMQIPPPETP
jgi:Flp pilus assembly secretin CpaC